MFNFNKNNKNSTVQLKKVIAVYDKKACFFASPMVFDYSIQAERSFSEEVKNPNSQLGKFPADFALYHIADFDPEKGLMIPLEVPFLITEAMAYVPNESVE